MPSSSFLSIPEAAQRVGVTPAALRARIRRGRLPAVRIGPVYAVDAAAVAKLAQVRAMLAELAGADREGGRCA